ncbi:unnamed protein product [Victoria cruziana]
MSRRLILQQACGQRSNSPPTAWELTVSQKITPRWVRYYFAIGHPGVFSLARWSLLIHTGFHVPHATRVRASPGCLLPTHGFSSSSKG